MKATRITLYTDNNGVEHRTKQDCEIADLSAELKTKDLQELKAIVQKGLDAAKLINLLPQSNMNKRHLLNSGDLIWGVFCILLILSLIFSR